MKFLLVFENSGDFLPFVARTNQDILEYYVSALGKNNQFLNSNRTAEIVTERLAKLSTSIADINTYLYELMDSEFELETGNEYISQEKLNQLHADWVNTHSYQYNIDEKRKIWGNEGLAKKLHDMYPDEIRVVMLGEALSKLGRLGDYDRVNTDLHNVEQSFNDVRFNTLEWVDIDNLFPKTRLTNDVMNFGIIFNHLGRTLYHKYQNFDMNLEYDDENTFECLHGAVSIRLVNPQTIPLSKEYVAWCKLHNKEPSGEFVNFGNLIDLQEKLTEYRRLIYRNLLAGNSLSIHI